ncbi:hypothetical protein LCGC14_1307650 [marine sediment metagenome]|uniref:Uncharacterized protein n=1 Tax=marine sediment metagenome TaxID=412755 RepID=A0A0F9N4E2_9ZZZZ
MKTMSQFCRRAGISERTKEVESNPNMTDMPAGSRHFKVTLLCAGRQMTLHFSMGPGNTEEPTVEDVLNCAAMDAAGYENAEGFEDWASEYGYDIDSREAEKTYCAVRKQTAKLAKFLATEQYNTLLWETESL